jgi:hypothetical protein
MTFARTPGNGSARPGVFPIRDAQRRAARISRQRESEDIMANPNNPNVNQPTRKDNPMQDEQEKQRQHQQDQEKRRQQGGQDQPQRQPGQSNQQGWKKEQQGN